MMHPDPDLAGAAPSAGTGTHDQHDALQRIYALLRERTGHDFRQYKPQTILRRLDRRLQVHRLQDLAGYRGLLEADPDEAGRLVQELLIGVTSFFRDRDDFRALEQRIVPLLFEGKGPDGELRAWSAACSTGEEAYSLAILLAERAAALPAPPKLQVFATDVDVRAVHAARAGIYPAEIAADVPAGLLAQYFSREGERYRVQQALREAMLFAEHNLLADPPFSRLDLITCRNFLIYLNRDYHRQVLELFHFALNPGGFLFLGSAETADAAADLFAPVDGKHRLYQARPAARHARAALAVPASRVAPYQPLAVRPRGRALPYAELHRRSAALAAPPSILVDRAGAVLHIAEDAAAYLRHPGGEPTRDLVALVLPELRPELRSALFGARQAARAVGSVPVRVALGGTARALSVVVRPVAHEDGAANDGTGLLLVQFYETNAAHLSTPAEAHGQDAVLLHRLDEELHATRRKLQATMDQADAAAAESRMANEWLQSTTTELRTALEEGRGMQEELKSVNEELMTVIAQLRMKVEETAKAHDDLSNLIASTDIATIFLDRALRIKRYTPRVRDVFNVLPGDVGRPLAHLAGRIDYPQLVADAAGVLKSLQPLEREVPGSHGRFYIVRIHPYRTLENRIDGAVMTFFDITRRRAAEQALRRSDERHRVELERQVRERTAELERSRDLLRATMDSSMDMIRVFEAVRDAQGTIVDFRWALNNHTSESRYGEVRGESLLERNPGVVAEGIFDAFRQVVETGEPVTAERYYPHEQFSGWFLQSVVRLGDGVATTTKDITAWKQAQQELLDLRDKVAQARLRASQQALHVSEQHLRLAMAAAGMFAWQVDIASGRLRFSDDADAIAGLPLADADDPLARIDALSLPEDRGRRRAAYARAMRGGGTYHEIGRFMHPHSGEPVWLEGHGVPIDGPDGRPERLVGVGMNITARKRAEEALRTSEARHAFLLQLADALRPLDDAGDIVCTAARVLGERLGTDRACYVSMDADRRECVVEGDWHRPGATGHARRCPLEGRRMPWLDSGATWVVHDVDTDPVLPDAQRLSYRDDGIRAAVVVPLLEGGRPVAAFVASQRQPRAWTATEVALIEDTAQRIRAAVERSKAQAAPVTMQATIGRLSPAS